MKLTKAQLEVLRELAKPDAKAYYTPYSGRNGGNYWHVSFRRCTKQIRVLLREGLLLERGMWNDVTASITPKGRELIEGGNEK